jgi:S1-C subfamily serine protease
MTRLVLVALAGLALAGIALGVIAERGVKDERSSRRTEVQQLQSQLAGARHHLVSLQARAAALHSETRALARQLGATRKSLQSSLAPLAARVARSVFTVDTSVGFGTAWAAWRAGRATDLITAYHVVEPALARGTHDVTINRKLRSWPGVIVATDSVNDLAVVRVANLRAPPLWQTPVTRPAARVGDRVILVGSPYGMEGTVTAGVLSRIASDQLLTDAPSNPGNSGGPAVDADGRVIGVLRSSISEDLSFLVPIQRACVTVRHCT